MSHSATPGLLTTKALTLLTLLIKHNVRLQPLRRQLLEPILHIPLGLESRLLVTALGDPLPPLPEQGSSEKPICPLVPPETERGKPFDHNLKLGFQEFGTEKVMFSSS